MPDQVITLTTAVLSLPQASDSLKISKSWQGGSIVQQVQAHLKEERAKSGSK